jgi:uncharacterized OB-fold protein
MTPFVPGPDTAPWWQRLRDGALTVQVCVACGAVQGYPRSACTVCARSELELRPATGRASVYSFTVVWRAPEPAMQVPYVLALVDLEEGPRLLTRLVDVATSDVRIGMAVRLVRCEVLSDAVALPLFGPRAPADSG